MDTRYALKKNISDESLAYGFTLSVWGSGAVLLASVPQVTPEMVLSFGAGSVLSFGIISELVFNSLLSGYEIQARQKRVVASMIHVFGAGVNVSISFIIVKTLETFLPYWLIFFGIGFHVMVTYNLMLLVEIYLSEILYKYKNREEFDGSLKTEVEQ
jgi:hypothetical protein